MSKYPADINEWTGQNLVDYFEEAVNFPDDCESWVQDHLVGNVAFSYGVYTANEDVYNQIEAAYDYLVTSLGATADF